MLKRTEGDFYDTGFDTDRFDVAYNAGVFEHLGDDQASELLREMTRITKPGGYVVIAIPNVESPFYKAMQEGEKNIYRNFKDLFARLPWEEKRRTFDFEKLMTDASLDFVKEDGLLIPPSAEVKMKDIKRIPPDHAAIFENYLSPDPPTSIGGILSNWRGLHGSVDSNFRRIYGWSIYAVGQKKAA